VRQAVRCTGVANLDLLTASADLASADVELGSYRQREQRLARALAPIADEYDFIVLDCPPGLTLLPLNALAAADVFVTPVAPHFLAIDALTTMMAAAERTRANHNRDLALGGILLTMVDYRSRETRRNVDAIRAEYGDGVFGVEVRVNVRLAEAPAAAQTIFEYAPDATGAAAYRLVAEELLLRLEALAARRGIAYRYAPASSRSMTARISSVRPAWIRSTGRSRASSGWEVCSQSRVSSGV
jgi:chromosome partitioning protein